jgi:tripartite-type tricarboxylate transporter receptor subunit TctC
MVEESTMEIAPAMPAMVTSHLLAADAARVDNGRGRFGRRGRKAKRLAIRAEDMSTDSSGCAHDMRTRYDGLRTRGGSLQAHARDFSGRLCMTRSTAMTLHERVRAGAARRCCAFVAAAAVLLTAQCAAAAQESYPQRPVRVVVAFAPGGGTDIVARALSARLSSRLGQQFVVDNRPGGGGSAGIELVARAQPDGYTLLVVSSSFAANAALRKTAYDPIGGFQPISLLSRQALLLLVHPSVPVNSVKELIALARAKPGALSYGSSGNGGIQHLATEMFKTMAKVDIVHVPYKGTGPALNELIGGQIQMSMLSIVATLSHARSGKLKGLAVSSSTRSDAAPEIPTIAEAGVPGYAFYGWYCMLAPANTPRSVVDPLNAAVVSAIQSPDVRDRMAADGSTVVGSSPDELGAHLRSEIAKLKKVVADAGIRIEDAR